MNSGRPRAFLAWCSRIFGPIALDRNERALRFIEEAIELGHATGLPPDKIGKMVERVYSRPAGEMRREVAQCAVTLELFAENVGLSVEDEAEVEWQRVQSIPKEEWERRHAAKVALGIAG